MERALIDPTFADKGDDDVVAAVELARERGAGRERQTAGDDAVSTEHPTLNIGEMHRAAATLAYPGRSPIQLRKQAVEGKPLGDCVAVATMSRRDTVTGSQ